MKKLILTTMIVMASLQGFAGQEPERDARVLKGQDGGGGGVIKRDGMYLTFGSAGMKVKIGAPQGLQQIPGLDLLIGVLGSSLDGMPDKFMGQMLNAVEPSMERRYFKIEQKDLDSNTYGNLIKEYAKLLSGQIDPKNLDLAAITIKNDTFLLPPFFVLKESEQAAILFHESIWILKPEVEYQELVNAEMTMQAHIQNNGAHLNVYNPELAAVIGGIFKNYGLVVYAALEEDVKNGLFIKYKFPVEEHETYSLGRVDIKLKYGDEEKAEYTMWLRKMMSRYPEFKFLKILYSLRTKTLTVNINSIPAKHETLQGLAEFYTYSHSDFLGNMEYEACVSIRNIGGMNPSSICFERK